MYLYCKVSQIPAPARAILLAALSWEILAFGTPTRSVSRHRGLGSHRPSKQSCLSMVSSPCRVCLVVSCALRPTAPVHYLHLTMCALFNCSRPLMCPCLLWACMETACFFNMGIIVCVCGMSRLKTLFGVRSASRFTHSFMVRPRLPGHVLVFQPSVTHTFQPACLRPAAVHKPRQRASCWLMSDAPWMLYPSRLVWHFMCHL